MGRDVYCLGLGKRGKGRESIHRSCLVQGLMFRVVIVNRNAVVCSYEVAKMVLLSVY